MNNHSLIHIESSESLFFRDSRLESNLGKGIFPPFPSVFLGAIRSYFFALNEDKFITFQTNQQDSTEEFKIDWFSLRISNSLEQQSIYPMPADLRMDSNGSYKLCPIKKVSFVSNIKNPYYVDYGTIGKESTLDKYFSEENLLEYVNASREIQFLKIDLQNYVESYEVINNTIDSVTGVVQDGNLFSSERVFLYKRMSNDISFSNKLSFLVEYTTPHWDIPIKGRIALGSDATPVSFTKEHNIVSIMCPIIEVGEAFKMLLITPAIFENGSTPSQLISDHIEILAQCASSKPISVGGWDIIKKAPKQMMKAVAPGAVFFLRVNDKEVLQSLLGFHKKSISDYRVNEGFGLVLFAKCPPNQIKEFNRI